MFVKFMYADKRQNRRELGTSVECPKWEEVANALLALDGKQRTMVLLSDTQGGDRQLTIAGQWDGRVMVNATLDNYDFFTLVDSARSTKKVTLCVGGQDGDYEERACVPIEWGLEAAKTFFECGELNAHMSWQSDY